MVEYADFYVLIATLSPVFLLGSLVGHYRLVAKEVGAAERRWAWTVLVMNVVATVTVVGLALLTLAGFSDPTSDQRGGSVFLVAGQLVVAAAFAVWESHRASA